MYQPLIERRSNSNAAEGNLSMADQQDGGELSITPPRMSNNPHQDFRGVARFTCGFACYQDAVAYPDLRVTKMCLRYL